MQQRARATWKQAVERDAAYAGIHRERRLMLNAARRSPIRPIFAGAMGLALGGLLVGAWFTNRAPAATPSVIDRPEAFAPSPSETSPTGTRAAVTRAPSTTSRPGAAGTSALLEPNLAPGMVAGRGCAGCKRSDTNRGDVVAGAPLGGGESIAVPPGATLTLGWSMGAGLVDPASFVDVFGPADVQAPQRVGAPLILNRGSARAEARLAGEVQSTLVRTRGENATWRIDARPGRTRVEVIRGEILVEELDGAHRRTTVHAGEHLEIASERSHAAPIGVTPSPAQVIAESVPLEDAARSLPRLAALGEHQVYLDALGEIADGKREIARSRLHGLLDGADPTVAADAAALLASTFDSPRQRVELWRRYLSAPRPGPQFEEAMVELANALLDLDDPLEARIVVDAVQARISLSERGERPESMSDAARAGLLRAEGRLVAKDADDVLERDVRKLQKKNRR